MRGSLIKRCGCVDASGAPTWRSCELLARGKHGTWAYRVDLGPGLDAAGVFRQRRQRYRSGFATKADAAAALAELSTSVHQGSHLESSRLTLAVYLQQWLDGRTRLRPTTRESYDRYLQRYFVPLLGHIELRSLRAVDIERAYAEVRLGTGRGIKRHQPVSAATLLRIHSVLKAALNTAVRRKLLPYNPALGVELEQIRRPRVRPYEPQELGRFLDTAASHHLGPLFEVLALTGLRRGEAVGLRWQDVDLDKRVLVVRQQVVRQGGRLMTGPPKTRSGEERRVDLDLGTAAVLAAHRRLQADERRRAGLPADISDLVFGWPDGSPYSPDYVSRQFKLIAAKAGLPAKRLHDLRHGAASLQLAAGVPLAVVSQRLGHSTVTLTADTYSHLLEGVGRDAAERSAALVPRRGGGSG